jgi:hypothetical protein
LGNKNETSPFISLFGETLYRWNEERTEILEYPTMELLDGKKVVGIYYRFV